MTTEELKMMDELYADPDYRAWLDARWEETMENLDKENIDVKEAV